MLSVYHRPALFIVYILSIYHHQYPHFKDLKINLIEIMELESHMLLSDISPSLPKVGISKFLKV
jgi:hypothetical protein